MALWKSLRVKEIPVGGFRGVYETAPATGRPLNVPSVVSNLVHDDPPSLSTRPGITALGSAVSTSATRGIHQYVNIAGTTVQTFAQSGSVLKRWDDSSSWILAFNGDNTFTKLSNPGTLPTGIGRSVDFGADGAYLAVGHEVTPFITIYSRSSDTFTKLSNPATLPTGLAADVKFSVDGTFLAVAHTTTPYITIYSRSGDVFTKLADPATLPAGDARGVAWSADGTYLAVTHVTSPYVTIYKRSGNTFTKLADPATLPTGVGDKSAFSPNGTYLAIPHATTPFVTIYKRAGDVFTKLADPATLPTGTGDGAAFSPDSTYLSIAHATTPFVTIYKRSSDTFTKLSDPATLPASTGNGTAFSLDGMNLAVAHTTTPYISVYSRSSDTFTKIANPATLPTGNGRNAAFSTDGIYLAVALQTSPYAVIYKRDNTITVPDKNFTAANLNDYACFFWAGTAPVKWNGSTMTALGGTPPQGEFVVQAYGKIFVSGIAARAGDVDWCDDEDPETWTPAATNTAGTATITQNTIKWAGFDARRGQVLFWTTRDVIVLIGPETPNNPDLWSNESVCRFGTPNGKTVRNVRGTWIWLTNSGERNGFVMWSSGEGDVVHQPIADSIDAIDWANIANANAWLDEGGRYVCSVPNTSSTYTWFTYDPEQNSWYGGTGASMRATGTVTVSGEDFTVVGSSVGLISKATGTDDNGTAIEWELVIGPSALGNAFVNKQITRIDVVLSKAAAATANLYVSTTESGSYGTAKVLAAGTAFTQLRVPVPVASGDAQRSGVFRLKISGSGTVTLHDVLIVTYESGS